MKLVLSVVVTLVVSILPSLALAWPDAGGPDKRQCETILQLEVFDTDVQPPFAHVKKWLSLIKNSPGAKVIKRSGNLLTVSTTNPNDIIIMAGRDFSPVTKITIDGKIIPLYHRAQSSTLQNSASSNAQRAYFYRALSYLPEGHYGLVDTETKQTVSMKIDVGPNASHPINPLASLGVTIEVWPGNQLIPQSEEFFHEKSIAAVSSMRGVDAFYINMFEDSFAMGSSYGMGEYDEIKFNLGGKGQLVSIETKGRTYDLVAFRPLRHESQF